MARRAFLHVGAPKSGTTFLQSVLWANKDRLRESRVLLPGADQFDAFYATMNVRGISREAGLPDRATDAWPRLVADAAEWPGDVVISHEFFAAATAEQAAAARRDLAPAEVHVVMTVRDYVAQVPALWQESVKVGSQTSFERFVAQMLGNQRKGPLGWAAADVVAVLDRWGTGLAPHTIHVVTVPRPDAPSELLWHRMCEVLALDPSGWEIPQTRRNQSLGAVQVEMLRRLNPWLQPPLGRAGAPHYRWIRRYLAEDILVSQGGRRVGLPRDAAAALRHRGEAAVRSIEERGWDVVGDLKDLVAEPLDSGKADPGDVDTDEMLDEAMRTIAELVKRQRRADRAMRRQPGAEPGGPTLLRRVTSRRR